MSKYASFYIFAISAALMVYGIWEFLHYIEVFAGLSTPKPWELDPFNATAFPWPFFVDIFFGITV